MHVRTCGRNYGQSGWKLTATIMSTLPCCVCTGELQASAQSRRILNPVSRSNARERALFLRFVHPGFEFSAEGCTYACQQTCFNKLKKAANCLATFQALISDLRSDNQVATKYIAGECATQ